MTPRKLGQRGRPPRKRDQPNQSTVAIGNCRVEFPASFGHSLDAEGLHVTVSDACTVDIKVARETSVALAGYSVTLLNPKSLDGVGNLLLQDVLKLYVRELPAMNYAANTGKESPFLEKCVFGGKYCTLVLRNAEFELLGAMTYQILPTDTNQAELPLAAVAQAHHRKGFGSCLYKQLQRRLVDVGVLSIFCWGDEESKAFWAKQGFVTVAEVDGRGKPCKLPIKADVKRAMSIPGSATLMISHLNSPSILPAFRGPPTPAVTSHEYPSGTIPEKSSSETCKAAIESSPTRPNLLQHNEEKETQKSSPQSIATPQVLGENKSSHVSTVTLGQGLGQAKNCEAACEEKKNSITPFNMEGILSTVASTDSPKETASLPLESPPAEIESVRPPLADTSNTVSPPDSANMPLKKRPITRAGLARGCNASKSKVTFAETTSTMDGVEESLVGEETKADEAGSPAKRKTSSTSTPKENIEPKKRGRPASRVRNIARVGHAPDKENKAPDPSNRNIDCAPIPAASPDSKSTNKRSRDPDSITNVFGTRARRRRKEDPVTNVEPVEEPEPQPAKETADRPNNSVQGGVQLMLDILLPCNLTSAGRCLSKEAEKPPTDECPDGTTTTITKSDVHTVADTDDEDQKPTTTEALGPQQVNGAESAGQQPLNGTSPVVVFLNMKDEKVKTRLTKDVERLSGTVTRDGCKCSHVVTDEVRRTLNVCVAITSGAWILSSGWIKKSLKQKSFADEAPFVLKDRKFESKYKVSLQDVIRRAKERPNLLLDGMYIYPTPHVHPPVDTISQIVEAAGGKVLSSLDEALQLGDKSQAAVVASEEDMSDAISAAKAGLRTFSSDWLLTCVVKQELDLTATQFSESL